jgi:hypothetical protein
MASVSEILYSKISLPEIQAAALRKTVWALVLDIYTRCILYFEKGYRVAMYDEGLTTVIYNGEMPTAMTLDNCQDYRYRNNRIVFDPVKRASV